MPAITVNVTTAENNRVNAAFGKRLGLRKPDDSPRDANAAEVKRQIIQFLKEAVANQERKDAAQTAADAVTEIDPT